MSDEPITTEFRAQLDELTNYALEKADVAQKIGNIEICDLLFLIAQLSFELYRALFELSVADPSRGTSE